MVNLPEIEFLLESHGFIGIDPEELSYHEQAELFASAEIVVGIMGAAVVNTVFCAPTTKILYLAPSGWMEPFYWDLAAVLRHKYIVVYGARENLRAEPFLDDFSIDPVHLRDALTQSVLS